MVIMLSMFFLIHVILLVIFKLNISTKALALSKETVSLRNLRTERELYQSAAFKYILSGAALACIHVLNDIAKLDPGENSILPSNLEGLLIR